MERRENPLLRRVEVTFRVSHPKESTPARGNLRQELAKALHATKDIVVVDYSRSEFGRSASVGYAKVYKSKEDALHLERKHILVRNGLVAPEVKAEKKAAPKPAPPPRREEKPAPKPEKAPAKEEKAPAKEEAPKLPEKKEEKPAARSEKKPEGRKGGKEGK